MMIKSVSKICSFLSLVVLVFPSYLYFTDKMNHETAKNVMLAATAVWFITASIWMWKND